MSAKYAIGIDLGTTNSALAYSALSDEPTKVEILSIPQLIAPSSVEARPLRPSFLYVGTEQDASAKAYDLPWAKKRDFAVGAVAQKQAADVPTRTVVAAKSWLAYSKVYRHAPILPWNAPTEVAKVSPVEASKRYMDHLVAAWAAAFPKDPIRDQRVVLTVPASFDASARELTREAALAAGLPENLVLLEEPRAALYAWPSDHANDWRKQLKVGDTLLVCDVGGGTTDLTLIQATEENGSDGRRGFIRRWGGYLDDLRAFLDQPALRSPRPLFMLGHSHGGLVIAAAAIAGQQGIDGCILASPFFGSRLFVPWFKRMLARLANPLVPWLRVGSGLSQTLTTSDESMRRDSEADPLLLRSATPRWYLQTRQVQRDILATADQFTLPLLLLHGGADPIADESAAREFFDRSQSTDKRMIVYPGLLHELLRETTRQTVFADILSWMRSRSGTE